MITSQERLNKMRFLIIDILRDKYRDEEVTWPMYIGKFKALAKEIRESLPKYFDLKIQERYFMELPDYKHRLSCSKEKWTEEEFYDSLISLLRRMAYMVEFLGSHTNFSAIDDADANSMMTNFAFAKNYTDGKVSVDAVSEVLSYFEDLYMIVGRFERDMPMGNNQINL